jgi:hypothetical protein
LESEKVALYITADKETINIMKQPIKVVMLPTDDSELGGQLKNTIYEHSENKSLVIGYLNARSTKHVPQHVYITVSQNVQKDGVHIISDGKLYITGWNERGIYNVIIATTDPKLTIFNTIDDKTLYIPQVQQSFLKELVANPDGEYEVKYEASLPDCPRNRCSIPHCSCVDVLTLKLNKDNEVNITSVNNRSNKIKSIAEELRVLVSAKAMIPLDDWIKENL